MDMLPRMIKSTLEGIGWVAIGEKTYRCITSADELEKILIIEKTEKFQFLQSYFGARNAIVEEFSWECLTGFSPRSPKIPYMGQESLLIRFPVGRPSSNGLWKLEVVSTASRPDIEVRDEFVKLVRTSTDNLKDVKTVSEFNKILLLDEGPFCWDRTNPVSRAAQVFAFSRLSHVGESEIYDGLLKFSRRIESQLRGVSFPEYFRFVSRKWTDGFEHSA